MAAHSAINLGVKLLIFGGCNLWTREFLGDLWLLDLEAEL